MKFIDKNSTHEEFLSQQFVSFENVRFSYPPVEGDVDQEGNQIIPPVLLDHFTAVLPKGFVSLVGPNAVGKSTLLLLASGRLLPQEGCITLLGRDTATLDEITKNNIASFIYQNMEFDTEDILEDILHSVYDSGNFQGKHPALSGNFQGIHSSLQEDTSDLFDQIVRIFDLKPLFAHKLTGLSKGEMQRVILAFSLLYGSESIFMDEPLFALEQPHKHVALAYIKAYSRQLHITIYMTMHELELNRKYPDKVLLIYPNKNMDLGTPEEVLLPESLEKAYGVPAAMLKDAESLSRKALMEQYQAE